MAFGALAYYRQIASLPPPIGRGLSGTGDSTIYVLIGRP